MAKRQMKVYDYHYETEYGSKPCPQIRIRGKYLKEAGFNIGDKIDLSVSQNQIVIQRVETPR